MSAKNKKGQNEPAKRGKKDKSKGKKKLEIKLSRVEETFYQLTVADCEKKLNHLRKHLQYLDENNKAMKEQIRSLYEDKVDAAAQLTNKVNTANGQIYQFNEKIHELSQEYFDVKSRGDATISDLEEKYKAMHDQLTAEVKLLKSHLNMLEEFPKIEERLNYVNELEEERRREKEQENKELILSTERRIKGEREAMRKEIERKMLHVSEEFTRSSTLRNAAYTQRLIRENIALEKEINVLESTFQSTDQHLKEQVARYKEVKATFPTLNQKKRELIMVAQQKTTLIEELTSKYESIKAAYVESLLYKTQYEDLVKYQQCGHFQRKELIKQAKKIGTNAHALKTECLHMEADFERNKQEIENLKSVIALIRETTLKAIGVFGDGAPKGKKTKKSIKLSIIAPEEEAGSEAEIAATDETIFKEDFFDNYDDDEVDEAAEERGEEEEEAFETHSKSLLEKLFNIINYYNLHKMSTASLETIPYDHLLKQHAELCEQSSDSLREAYKHGVVAQDVRKQVSDRFTPAPHVKQTIPTERPERCQLFDVEKGSSLYVSLSDSNPEMVSVEEQPDDQDDVADSSSSSYSNISNETPTQAAAAGEVTVEKKASKSKLSLREMPPGTILDVEMLEEIEEEDFQRTERDDVYLADTDRENTKGFDATIGEEEQGEEEMPIYMFY